MLWDALAKMEHLKYVKSFYSLRGRDNEFFSLTMIDVVDGDVMPKPERSKEDQVSSPQTLFDVNTPTTTSLLSYTTDT